MLMWLCNEKIPVYNNVSVNNLVLKYTKKKKIKKQENKPTLSLTCLINRQNKEASYQFDHAASVPDEPRQVVDKLGIVL